MSDDITRVGGGGETPDNTVDETDIGLITDYLARELPPERVADGYEDLVRRLLG
jgi:hypothetical protein